MCLESASRLTSPADSAEGGEKNAFAATTVPAITSTLAATPIMLRRRFHPRLPCAAR